MPLSTAIILKSYCFVNAFKLLDCEILCQFEVIRLPTAIYLRKSRAEDAGETIEETLSKHKKTLLEFADHNHLSIVHIYEEVVSGDSLVARPEMLQLLSDVEAEKYDSVLCMDIDRLGRGSMSDQGLILQTFKNSNTKIITPRKVYDLNNEMDEEYTEFETFLARRELKLIKRRLQRGTQEALRDGAYVADPPYGYVRSMVGKRSSLAINEEEAVYVRMIFDMYIEGIGCQNIADHLNSLGAKPHRANQFGRTSIARILKNPVYIGKVAWNQKSYAVVDGKRRSYTKPRSEWSIIDGLHPAIISKETYNRVQEIFNGRWHPPYYSGQLENPMAGIVRCASCGTILQRRPYKQRNEPEYLICPTRGCCCASKLSLVEKEMLCQIRDQLTQMKLERASGTSSRQAEISQALTTAEKNLQTLRSQRDRLHDLLEQGIYTIDTFVQRNEHLVKKIQAAQITINNLHVELNRHSNEGRDRAIARIESVLSAYDTATPNEQNTMLKSIVTQASYYKEKGWKPDVFVLAVSLIQSC